MIRIKVDIVGGSIGGLSTAITIKEWDKKIKVIIHEKHKKIGYNPEGRRCGEGFSVYKGLEKWRPIGKSIFNVIEKQEFIIGDKTYNMPKDPLALSLVILNRQEFISQLGKRATDLNVEIQTNDRIKSVHDLDGDYIVDASGCPSSIKRELGLNRGLKGISYQQTLENSNYFTSDTVRFIFMESIVNYWIFPRNPEKKEINLGIGLIVNRRGNLKEMLEKFKKERGIEGKINYVTGGLVPIGLQKPLMRDNILFVGDAGVGTFPITGEGIYRALISGGIAGKCIATGRAKQYSPLINKRFCKEYVFKNTLIRSAGICQRISSKVFLNFLKYYYKKIFFPRYSNF